MNRPKDIYKKAKSRKVTLLLVETYSPLDICREELWDKIRKLGEDSAHLDLGWRAKESEFLSSRKRKSVGLYFFKKCFSGNVLLRK